MLFRSIARQKTRGVEADVFFNVTRDWSFNVGGAKMDVTLPSGLYPRGSPRSTANFNTRYKFSAADGPFAWDAIAAATERVYAS